MAEDMDETDDDIEEVTNDGSETEGETGKINLNSATKEELMTIPGIGEKTAQDIINHRKRIGKFKSVNELADVKNLKVEHVEELKKWIEL
jgi:competence protein ComEA